LHQTNVDSWRKGRIDVLEEFIQGRPDKISFCLEFFRQWAHQKGLKPSEAAYVRTTRAGTAPLQFTHAADPETEKNYRIHYLSAALTESKRQHLEDKLNQAPRPVVFEILRESQCVECGTILDEGSCLFMEADQSLCLACASFGDLEYLAAGDTALTRRATKYSERVAIVVRFSRSRKRYERQGVLLEAAALNKAEHECVQDADARAASRLRAAERRRAEDRELVSQMTEQIGVLFPGCPPPRASSHRGAHRASGKRTRGTDTRRQGTGGTGIDRSRGGRGASPAHGLRQAVDDGSRPHTSPRASRRNHRRHPGSLACASSLDTIPRRVIFLAAGEMQTATRFLSFQLWISEPWSEPACCDTFIPATGAGGGNSES
jgi:hypothetical protein